jgi:hypothetical protein
MSNTELNLLSRFIGEAGLKACLYGNVPAIWNRLILVGVLVGNAALRCR